ncbi:MAG: aldo/keto reductase [Rubrivivax sp.]|nr:aldo/keto reductase [Rubrivivax sp.]MDH5338257.1 aldo/keto reductase [Rubrivivax sp.]
MKAAARPPPTVTLPSGQTLPALGLGTWRYGESATRRAAEVAALRQALDLGYRVFDSAEMYGDGGAEAVLGQAIAEAERGGQAREDLFIVSKVLPHNAHAAGVRTACDASRRRLGVDCIDLYLLHWPGPVPLDETVAAFERLQARGHVRAWGVSNFDLDDMQALSALPGGRACATNQVWYSLTERGPEFALRPWQRVHQMPLMAYCPIDQGALADHPALRGMAERHGATPAQVALAWLLAQGEVMAIPKASNVLHLRHNLAAADLSLSAADLAELDRLFPPPRRKRPLAMR